MGISINLEFGDGDFERGFAQNQFVVTVATSESKITLSRAQLSPSPEIPELYKRWKDEYHSLLKKKLLKKKQQRGFKNPQPTHISSQVSSQNYGEQARALQRQLHEWLKPVKLELEPILQQYADSEIHLIVHTEKVTSPSTKYFLHRLPWQEWDLFFQNFSSRDNTRKNYTGEAALCFHSHQAYTVVESSSNKMRRVKIISIFGDSEGIDTDADQELISKLKKRGAELIYLTQPSRTEFNTLWEEPCDILFFAGHSNTQSDGIGGVIHLNRDESLSLADIKKTLSAAIRQGLKLAIFNSCDGLGLAFDLAQLNLPYIIVWREVVPDKIAQKFLEYFLSSFASGKSLFASVEEARIKLCELEDLEKQLPGVTWLPIICQNTIEPPPCWSDLGGLTGKLPDNPYRGLSAFREKDAPFYFGPEKFIADLLLAVYNMPLVAVIGASGSGKSSVVFAGLVPRLRTTRDVAIISFRPEDKPFDNLAIALSHLDPNPEPYNTPRSQLDNRLAQIGLDLDWRHDETKLCNYIQTIISASGYQRLVLIADQFEELYTLTTETERCSFLKALYFAIKDTSNFTLVLTLRADFLGIVLNSLLGKALQEYAPKLLTPMDSQELRDAIEKPAEKMKVELSPGLTNKLIADLGNHPGRLPLLEFALTQLWEKQENWYLTHEAYEEIGGLEKALAKHADEVLDELQLEDLENRYKAERIFIQLVSPGAGTEDTRRVATRQEVGSQNWDLVQKLADKRLVVTGRDETNGVETVEIVHEALIREWGTLREWIQDNREFRTWQERLKPNVREWQDNQYDSGRLLQETSLSVALKWYKERFDELTDQEKQFIEASAEKQKKQEEEKKRSHEFTTFLIDAEAGRIISGSEKYFNTEAALINAIKDGKLLKNRIWKPEIPFRYQMQTVSNLQEIIYKFEVRILKGHTDTVTSVKFSPDGKTVASASYDGTVKLWNATTEREIKTLTGHRYPVTSVIFSPDGKTVASASHNGTVKLWDATTGTVINTLTGHTSIVWSVIFSPDGKTVASASYDKTVKLWDATNGREIKTFTGHRYPVTSVKFSPDGKTVASASHNGTVKLWDATTGTVINTLTGHTSIVWSVIFSPDGKTVASASYDGTVKLWDATTGTVINTLTGHKNVVTSVIFSPDGKTVASASRDGTVKLWDATNGRVINTLTGHTSIVWRVIFSPDGKTVASASNDKTVKLWDATNGREINTLTGHTDTVTSVIFSPDGKTVASASADKTVILWDLDLDNLLVRGCRLIRNYLKHSPDVSQEDRNLCDGIGS
ncbi:WD-repeat protein [Kalymmatonema gypsitolerans NIES-4073]|nr:WD-repeat protein [Scytonema sp. NIES-4073]